MGDRDQHLLRGHFPKRATKSVNWSCLGSINQMMSRSEIKRLFRDATHLVGVSTGRGFLHDFFP